MAQAGAMGIPFVPVRGLLGTDLLRARPDFRVIPNPFRPEERVVVCPPLRPDLLVVHARVADRQGNAFTPPHRDDPLVARCARRVVVTAEEVVEGPLTPRDGEGTFLPGVFVDGVVHLPGGAHPTPCPGAYGLDRAHLEEYLESARTAEGFQTYLERYVYGLPDEAAYLERVGWTARR